MSDTWDDTEHHDAASLPQMLRTAQEAARSFADCSDDALYEAELLIDRLSELCAKARGKSAAEGDGAQAGLCRVSPGHSDMRPAQQFSLHAPTMNRAIQEQYVGRERHARQQVRQPHKRALLWRDGHHGPHS